jgi:hypothetical protein
MRRLDLAPMTIGIYTTSGLRVIEATWAVVVSGLAPRWVAKPPQTQAPRCIRKTEVPGFWGGFATQRGASPLTTMTLATRPAQSLSHFDQRSTGTDRAAFPNG